MEQSTTPLFMPRLVLMKTKLLSSSQRGVILTMRQVDPDLHGKDQRDIIAEQLPPETLIGHDVRKLAEIYRRISDYLNRHEPNVSSHSSYQIVRAPTSSHGMYPEERGLAEELAIEIRKRKSAKTETATRVIETEYTNAPSYDSPVRMPHSILMKLNYPEAWSSSDTVKCCNECLGTYNEVVLDRRLSEDQNLQILHNLLSKDVLRFYVVVVLPNVSSFQQAVKIFGTEYSLPVQQAKARNFLACSKINLYDSEGKEVSEALSLIYE